MVPSSVLRERTDQHRQAMAEARRVLAEQNRRIQELEGRLRPPAPEPDAETRAITEQFYKLFPWAEKLSKLPIDQLEQVLQAVPNLQGGQEAYWNGVGASMMRSLSAKLTDIYGKDLHPSVAQQYQQGFISWCENDPENRRRYMAADPTLVDDYWSLVDTNILGPVRRKATAPVERRMEAVSRLPRVGPSTNVPPGQRPPKPKNEDELHDQAWQAIQAARGA